MTRHRARRLLALALASAIAAPELTMSVVGQSLLARARMSPPAAPVPSLRDAFTVSDIRIDGLQRISAGTVFTYLPDRAWRHADAGTVPPRPSARCTRPAFSRTCSMDRQGDILVVTVIERPAINKLTLQGNKDIKTEDLIKGLKEIGLAEGETFDRLASTASRRNSRASTTTAASTTSRSRPRWPPRPQPRRRHDQRQGRQGRQDPAHQPGRQREVPGRRRSPTAGNRRTQLAVLVPTRRPVLARKALRRPGEAHQYYLDRGYVDFSVDSTQVVDQSRQARHVHHRQHDRRRAVQGLRRQGHRRHRAPAGRGSSKMVPVEDGQLFSRTPARIHLRRDHRVAGQHRLRVRRRCSRSRTIDKEKREVAHQLLQVNPGQARHTCATSSSRATPAPQTRSCAARCASSKARGIRRPRSTAPRSACSAWVTSRPSTVENAPGRRARDDQVDVVFIVKETELGQLHVRPRLLAAAGAHRDAAVRRTTSSAPATASASPRSRARS